MPPARRRPGRLVTTVTAGHRTRSATSASLPAVDDLQRVEAWGSEARARGGRRRRTCSAPSAATPRPRRRRSDCSPTSCAPLGSRRRRDPQRRSCASAATTTSSSRACTPTTPGDRIVGTREDPAVRPVPPRPVRGATAAATTRRSARSTPSSAGEVLVIEARGERGTGTVGDVLALRAQVRGAAGIVTDGGVRDFDAVAGVRHPRVLAGRAPARARPPARAVGGRRRRSRAAARPCSPAT